MSLEQGKFIVDVLEALLIPIVLFLLGQWIIRSKEHTESARRDADQLAVFLEHLSSESKERRKLALLALTHMHNAGLFPDVLLQSVESIAAHDDLEVAAVARLALGRERPHEGLSQDERALVLELLLPMKVHFDRTRQAFQLWVKNRPTSPNVEIEDAIKASNSVICNLLKRKWHIIPTDLQQDAVRLLEHYDAWSAEYERLRPNGVRDPKVPYVFVGPQGYPFPADAEQRFLARYAELASESGGSKTAAQPCVSGLAETLR
ncbi:MAG: hypothetical protein GY799_20775 [Desulfobulbaceae bacterium]|nr:hypothetical protein [Desulfobulbaceae bacterium]